VSELPAAVVKVEMANGGFTHPLDRGRFIGGGFVWDDSLRRFRDYDVHVPSAAQAVDTTLSGVAWEDGLQGLVLAWRVAPQSIDAEWWFGPQQVDGDGTITWPQAPSSMGLWRTIRPGGDAGVTLLQQYKVGRDDWELPSFESLPANPKFSVSMYREQTPAPEETTGNVPQTYTGVTFGGCWHVRLPMLAPAELWKLTGGRWKRVASHDWRLEELYGDSYGSAEVFLTIWCVDGKLLIKSSVTEDSWVYQEDRAISVAAAPLILRGNGGCAYFGLHKVEFAEGGWNLLVSRDVTTLDRMPAALPSAICVGSKPAGTYARAYQANADASEITSVKRSFRVGVVLYSADGTDTPVVRCAGLQFPPVSETGPRAWLDLTGKFISGSGTWSCDLEERCIKQSYSLVMDNSDGYFSGIREAKLLRLSIGRPGTENMEWGGSWSGGPLPRVCSVCVLDEQDDGSLASTEVKLVTIDRIDMLDEISCGERRPLDGVKVCDAIREIMSWGHVGADEIGPIYDSGAVLPSSQYALTKALETMTTPVGGELDTESGAACRIRAEASIKSALLFCSKFDYNTFYSYGPDCLLRYEVAPSVVRRYFRETSSPAAEDEILRTRSRRPRLREGHTSVLVGGRERSTGRPISSRAYDQEALTTIMSRRFRGWDQTNEINDEALNTAALAALRCRYEYLWGRRLRDQASWGAIGQRIYPPWKINVAGYGDHYVLEVTEEFDAPGDWSMSISGVTAS